MEQQNIKDCRKILQKEVPLEKWGPYLSERQWGTVREDYSANGDAWNYFPHDHARSGHTAGEKMDWQAFQIFFKIYVFRLHYGMERILF